jgi:serine/threonine protein kinase
LIGAHERAGSILDEPLVEEMAANVASGRALTESADPTGLNSRFASVRASSDNPDQGSDSDEIELGFLQPSERPDGLGRLGHYEVLEVVGQGGFGVVLKVFDEKLRRVVAIKVLKPSLAVTSPPRKRFLREARSAAAVRHENVVAIYAVEDAQVPYLVMEYVGGRSLQQKLDETGALDLSDILNIGQQIARGLADSHATGLIHRDIKPSNIMLEDGSGRVKITDFGLARTVDDASVTQSGLIVGTPLYMSPEQALVGTIDQRSDLFSLGSVLYTACCGRTAFGAPTTLSVLKRLTEEMPRPIREITPETPERLCAIIAKLLAKTPSERYATASEVADLLERCLSDLQQHGALQSLAPPPRPRGLAISWNKRKSVWGAAAVLIAGLIVVLLPRLATSPGSRAIDPAPARTPASRISPTQAPVQSAKTVPLTSKDLLPDRWYDLVAATAASGPYKKSTNGFCPSAVVENSIIQISAYVLGDYQLRSSFTRTSGNRSINYYFPVGKDVGILYFDIDGIDSLVIDEKFGAASPAHSGRKPLKSERRYEVLIEVALDGDDATIAVELDGQRHLRWTGPRSMLSHSTSSGHFAIGSRDGDTIFHELNLRLLKGRAWLE